MSVNHCLGLKMSHSASGMLGRHSRQGTLEKALVLEVGLETWYQVELAAVVGIFMFLISL